MLSTRSSSVLGPSRVHRGAHRERRLDALNERPLHELLFGEHTSRLWCLPMRARNQELSATARSGGQRADTYAQKTVEINATRVEGAMKVIDRILNRAVLGDQVDESVARIRI